MTPLRVPLQIVLYKDSDQWVAHCLQFDLIGVGDTKQEAMLLLNEAIGIQIHESFQSGNQSNLFCPADGTCFQMFAAGEDIAETELRVIVEPCPDLVIERTDIREFLSHPSQRPHCSEVVSA